MAMLPVPCYQFLKTEGTLRPKRPEVVIAGDEAKTGNWQL